MKKVKRGDIFMANLDPGIGSEQKGKRPVLIIQNNLGNKHAPTIIVAPITSSMSKTIIPTHVLLRSEITGLDRDSIVLLEQIRAIDKSRLIEKMGELSKVEIMDVEIAMMISLDLNKKEDI